MRRGLRRSYQLREIAMGTRVTWIDQTPPGTNDQDASSDLPLSAAPTRKVRSVAADLLVALMPLGAVLLAYVAAAWVNSPLSLKPIPGAPNTFGFRLHVIEPITIDRGVFGTLPTNWLQQQLHSVGKAQWWDGLSAVIYSSHFVVVPIAAALLWFHQRHRFGRFIWSVFALVAVGVALCVVYPMAPPWMAARQGFAEPIARISGLGWSWWNLGFVDHLQARGQNSGNTVAAMPSLHAGAASLIAAFFWKNSRWWAKISLVSYAIAMGMVLVYTGEHYVIDVAVGSLIAVGAVIIVGCLRTFTSEQPKI